MNCGELNGWPKDGRDASADVTKISPVGYARGASTGESVLKIVGHYLYSVQATG